MFKREKTQSWVGREVETSHEAFEKRKEDDQNALHAILKEQINTFKKRKSKHSPSIELVYSLTAVFHSLLRLHALVHQEEGVRDYELTYSQ